jgi:mannitol-1-/sugar-/sorbitol-6-phosphatase
VDVDGVLCDLDGVLVDSTAAIERSWRRFAERHALDWELVDRTIHGRPARESTALLLPEADLDAESALLDEWEVTDVEGIAPLPGALDLIARVPADRFAIVTSCRERLAHARLGAAGIEPPAALVTFDSVSAGKPAPDCYLEGARLLGLAPERCLAIEDAPAGLAAARAAGAVTAALTTTHAAEELDADIVVGTLADLASAEWLRTGSGSS